MESCSEYPPPAHACVPLCPASVQRSRPASSRQKQRGGKARPAHTHGHNDTGRMVNLIAVLPHHHDGSSTPDAGKQTPSARSTGSCYSAAATMFGAFRPSLAVQGGLLWCVRCGPLLAWCLAAWNAAADQNDSLRSPRFFLIAGRCLGGCPARARCVRENDCVPWTMSLPPSIGAAYSAVRSSGQSSCRQRRRWTRATNTLYSTGIAEGCARGSTRFVSDAREGVPRRRSSPICLSSFSLTPHGPHFYFPSGPQVDTHHSADEPARFLVGLHGQVLDSPIVPHAIAPLPSARRLCTVLFFWGTITTLLSLPLACLPLTEGRPLNQHAAEVKVIVPREDSLL